MPCYNVDYPLTYVPNYTCPNNLDQIVYGKSARQLCLQQQLSVVCSSGFRGISTLQGISLALDLFLLHHILMLMIRLFVSMLLERPSVVLFVQLLPPRGERLQLAIASSSSM